MDVRDILFNRAGRLRSGWRFAISAAFLYLGIRAAFQLAIMILYALLGPADVLFLESRWGFVVQGFCLLIPAILVGWVCGKLFEDLPPRALGWGFRGRWLRDF